MALGDYRYLDGEQVKLGRIPIDLDATAPFQSAFCIGFSKAGTVLMNTVANSIAAEVGIKSVDLPAHLNHLGIDIQSCLFEASEMHPRRGYLFGGFRGAPSWLQGRELLSKGKRSLSSATLEIFWSLAISH